MSFNYSVKSEKSVPITDIVDSTGIALEMSRSSPTALSLCRFTSCMSSREVAAAKKAIVEPTLPYL